MKSLVEEVPALSGLLEQQMRRWELGPGRFPNVKRDNLRPGVAGRPSRKLRRHFGYPALLSAPWKGVHLQRVKFPPGKGVNATEEGA